MTRQHLDRESAPELVPPGPTPVALSERVDAALADGCRSLAELVARVVPVLPPAQHYRAVGRVAALAAARARISAPLERDWKPVAAVAVELEDWTLAPEEAG